MELKKVHIKRFKNILDASLELDQINVLVGANNSGKSSILQALHFAISSIQSLEIDIGLSKIKTGQWNTIDPAKIIYIPSDDVYALGVGGRLMEAKDQAVGIDLTLKGDNKISVNMRKGRNRNILFSLSNSETATSIASIKEPFTIFTPGLAGIAKTEQLVSDGVLLRAIARGDSNLVLRNTLLRLWMDEDGNSRWDDFNSDFHEIFPEFDIEVIYDHTLDEFITVNLKKSEDIIPLEISGTGVLQMIQILSYIHYYTPKVIVLDEPDSHLHPNNQRSLCEILRQIAFERDIQVILCTHSRHIIDTFDDDAVFFWARNGQTEKLERGYDLSLLLDIGALDIKERLKLSKKKYLVLTEDHIERNLETLMISSGFSINDIDFLSYNGCTRIHNLRPLINIIQSMLPHSLVILHRDRDFYNEEEIDKWKKGVGNFGVIPFVTEGIDVESYYCNAEHLSTLNNDLDLGLAESLINDAIESLHDKLIEKAINGRLDVEKKEGNFGEVNYGKLSITLSNEIENRNSRYIYGKLFLRKIRADFRNRYKTNLIVNKPSKFLISKELKSILPVKVKKQ